MVDKSLITLCILNPISADAYALICYCSSLMVKQFSSVDFGPFTPQELERFVSWIKARNYAFEIIKDQLAENDFTLNDGRNAVVRADLRTEVYLAQIFTVRVEGLSSKQVEEINIEFKFIEDVPVRFKSDEKIIPFEPEAEATARVIKSAKQKQFWAAVIFVLVMILLIIQIYQIIVN